MCYNHSLFWVVAVHWFNVRSAWCRRWGNATSTQRVGAMAGHVQQGWAGRSEVLTRVSQNRSLNSEKSMNSIQPARVDIFRFGTGHWVRSVLGDPHPIWNEHFVQMNSSHSALPCWMIGWRVSSIIESLCVKVAPVKTLRYNGLNIVQWVLVMKTSSNKGKIIGGMCQNLQVWSIFHMNEVMNINWFTSRTWHGFYLKMGYPSPKFDGQHFPMKWPYENWIYMAMHHKLNKPHPNYQIECWLMLVILSQQKSHRMSP